MAGGIDAATVTEVHDRLLLAERSLHRCRCRATTAERDIEHIRAAGLNCVLVRPNKWQRVDRTIDGRRQRRRWHCKVAAFLWPKIVQQ